jgi:hypothetical protein
MPVTSATPKPASRAGRLQNQFMHARETLLYKFTDITGSTLEGCGHLGKTYDTAHEAVSGVEPHEIWRLDLETMTAEDVTEDCADAWLEDWDGTPDDDVPPFVAGSEAYEDWCEAYQLRDRVEGTCPPYQTINRAQLGLRSPVGMYRSV